LQGVPDGDHCEVGYSSSFANADREIDEPVSLSLENGKWRVLGHGIDRPRWGWR